MITAAEINKLLKDYVSSADGKKYIEHEISTNKEIQSEVARSYDEAVRTLSRLIYAHAPLQIRGSLDPGILMSGASAPRKDGDGYVVSINFQQNLLKRPSLYSKCEGAYDIVGLFVKGWEPKDDPPKRVFGPWRGHGLTPGTSPRRSSPNLSEDYVVSRYYKKADNFIVEAVNEFMTVYAKEYGVVDCVIDERYVAD